MSDKDESILFLDDLARLLRCSRSTIEVRRRERGNLPPEMERIDKRPRWYRPTVEAWMAKQRTAQQFKVAMGGRR